MMQSAAGLLRKHPGVFTAHALEEHVDDLLTRFANPALNDTVFRVGRDLRRKLSREDRVVGAMRMLARHGLACDCVAAVYRAALAFAAADDRGCLFPGDEDVHRKLERGGLELVMDTVSLLKENDPVDRAVRVAIRTAEPGS